jgi:hypothetical protein
MLQPRILKILHKTRLCLRPEKNLTILKSIISLSAKRWIPSYVKIRNSRMARVKKVPMDRIRTPKLRSFRRRLQDSNL